MASESISKEARHIFNQTKCNNRLQYVHVGAGKTLKQNTYSIELRIRDAKHLETHITRI